MDTTTLGYIVGGSIAGAVVLTAIIATLVLCTCSSKRKKKRHDKKFHTLSDSSRPSQHSTLSQIDPRNLPKVGGGLWVEAPAVYQAAPNQGLYYGRPNPKYRMEPAVQRANSDVRLAAPPPGHAVYQGNMRIYHSQQLAPVYEIVDTSRAPGVISIYEYNDLSHSRSRLINRNSAERHHQRDSKKVKRSQSDVSGQRRDKKDNSKKSQHSGSSQTSGADLRSSSRREQNVHAKVGEQKSQSVDSVKALGHDNFAFHEHPGYVVARGGNPSTAVSAPATDSMKIQQVKKDKNPIYNITDDEKQIPNPVEADIKAKHYVYEGVVYASPVKSTNIVREGKYENPIVARMEAMILEKTEEDDNIVQDVRVNSVAKSAASPVELVQGSKKHVTGSKPDVVDGSRHAPLSATLSEDIGPTGNQITSEAFQFLDSYMGSDDDGVDSPPISPASLKRF